MKAALLTSGTHHDRCMACRVAKQIVRIKRDKIWHFLKIFVLFNKKAHRKS